MIFVVKLALLWEMFSAITECKTYWSINNGKSAIWNMCVCYVGVEQSTVIKSGNSLQNKIQIIGINIRKCILQW